MIQDIAPDRLDNRFIPGLRPSAEDTALFFEGSSLLVRFDDDGCRLVFPTFAQYGAPGESVYLFSVSGRRYFLLFGAGELPEGFASRSMRDLRAQELASRREIFAAYTAFHLHAWYTASRFCGACGARAAFDDRERAMVCPACGNRVYPRLNPAVIVAVTNGDRILLTKYRAGFSQYALVAGFTEIGETVEDTVRREVLEETGLRVKNLRYWGSQPWGVASDILIGFFCDVDGDDAIRLDETELGFAQWVPREKIVLQRPDYSLTNAMMRAFQEGREPR